MLDVVYHSTLNDGRPHFMIPRSSAAASLTILGGKTSAPLLPLQALRVVLVGDCALVRALAGRRASPADAAALPPVIGAGA
jgi:hypothetical protein